MTIYVYRLCIYNNLITIEELNRRIDDYPYGYTNQSEKPSPIKKDTILKSNKVDQYAYQALLLMKTLPCMLYDKLDDLIDKEQLSDVKYLVSVHLTILSIVFSTEIPLSTAQSLEQLWIEHTLLLFAVFPNCNKINKIHQISHYFHLIQKCGPCRFFNVDSSPNTNFLKKRLLLLIIT